MQRTNCSSHAELLTNLRKIEKRPKIRHKAVMHPALQLIHASACTHRDTVYEALGSCLESTQEASLKELLLATPQATLTHLSKLPACFIS